MDDNKHKNRLLTHIYFLPIDGQLVVICQSCLLRTFNETKRFLTDVIKNKMSSVSGMLHDDLRGLWKTS